MISIQDVRAGQKIRLNGDIIAEVTQNPGDGVWLVVRYLSGPNVSASSSNDEMAYADDVLAIVE